MQQTPTQALFAQVRERLSRPFGHFIGGVWEAASEDAIEVLNPATGEVLGSISNGSAHDVARAVTAARTTFDSAAWRTMPAAERERLLLKLADLVEIHRDEIAAIETLDNGMPFIASRGMVTGAAVSAIRYNAGWARRLTGQEVPISVPGQWHGYTTHVPLGVAALIVPWNAPFAITCNKVSAALAAGCTVVLKPAELAPMSGLRLAELIQEASFPAGCLNVVTGLGATTGAALVQHPQIDKISFTGSTATGQSIMRQATEALTRVSLELGGKSASVVFPDADLARAVPAVAMGIFGNSGQVCAAGSRLFLHDAIFDRFIEELKAFAENLTVGAGQEDGVVLGPLISAGQKEKVLGYIQAGLDDGATLITGGDVAGDGYFVRPTIFTDATPNMRIVQEEIFGPVLSVIRFTDSNLDDLIKQANDSIYGLSAYVWTSNLSTAHKMANGLRTGSVKINGSGMDFALPFGGFKMSGLGRENGRNGVEAFTEIKSVMIGY